MQADTYAQGVEGASQALPKRRVLARAGFKKQVEISAQMRHNTLIINF
jgi:hypothetical protein